MRCEILIHALNLFTQLSCLWKKEKLFGSQKLCRKSLWQLWSTKLLVQHYESLFQRRGNLSTPQERRSFPVDWKACLEWIWLEKTADIWHGNQSAASGVAKCRLFSRSTVNRRHVKAVGWFPICSNQFPVFPCLSLSWFSKVRFLKRPYMYLCLLRLFPVSLAPVKGQGVILGTRTPICLIDSN